MNRLFVELYLDEDVDVLVADLVSARGFKATRLLGKYREKKVKIPPRPISRRFD
jgi:hypothetical protein